MALPHVEGYCACAKNATDGTMPFKKHAMWSAMVEKSVGPSTAIIEHWPPNTSKEWVALAKGPSDCESSGLCAKT